MPTLPVREVFHFLSEIIGHFPGMPARFLTELASNQGILLVNPLKSGVTFTSDNINQKMEGVLGVNPLQSGVMFTSDNIKQKMEAVGVGSYLIELNPNFRSSTSFPHSAAGEGGGQQRPAIVAWGAGSQALPHYTPNSRNGLLLDCLTLVKTRSLSMSSRLAYIQPYFECFQVL